ncbi:uncharacterized protein P174DRAFT_497395, partial [Aspergillus novofumigatus IBT 16806]
IQLYTLSELKQTPEELGSKLLSSHGITNCGNLHNYWPRVDVYSPLGSIEECMEHHRAEKLTENMPWRKCTGRQQLQPITRKTPRKPCGSYVGNSPCRILCRRGHAQRGSGRSILTDMIGDIAVLSLLYPRTVDAGMMSREGDCGSVL